MINFVLKTISDIYFGNNAIGQGYYGNTLVYQKMQPVVDAVVFEAKTNSTLGLTKKSSNHTLQYSTNGRTWNTFDTSTSISLNAGKKVYVRGILSANNTSNNYTQFKTTSGSNFKVSGNINTIFDYTAVDLGSTFSLYDYCGYSLFRECLISDVSELLLPSTTLSSNCYNNLLRGTNITTAPTLPATTLAADCYNTMFKSCYYLASAPTLPATTLASQCYRSMFSNCRSLTTPPALPATTLTTGCYYQMFAGDTNNYCGLTTTPELPATTLAQNCYYQMFQRCTSLTTAQTTLPATTLAESCYYGMFYGCSNLTTAPTLPAKVTVRQCYYQMFYNCTKLNYIKCLATDLSGYSGTYYWVYGVAATGKFVKDPNATSWQSGVRGIPTGWTVIDTVSNYITFTAKQDNSSVGLNRMSSNHTMQYSIDDGNTWNTFDTSTTISLNNNESVLIYGMLNSQNSSNNYTQFATSGNIKISGNIMAILNYQDMTYGMLEYACYGMFNNNTAITDISDLEFPNVLMGNYCCQYMFYGCSGLVSVPSELSASTLGISCYGYMFYGCSNIITAPALPAVSLYASCYYQMFRGCTNLTTAPALPATTLAVNCYYQMFYLCTSLTTAPELPATTLANYCYTEMFMGCTSLTTAPVLPATTLTQYCYANMFKGCSSLNYIKCLATNISASACTSGWVNGVAATGTFVKDASMTGWTTGNNGIPSGWTTINYIDYFKLEAKANSTVGLSSKSSNHTIQYSTDETNWSTMDTNTSISLNVGEVVYIRGILSADNTSSNYTQFSISGDVKAYGNINTFLDYTSADLGSAFTLVKYCCYNLFYQCSALTDAVSLQLPATTLSNYCYYQMFRGTAITACPALPATTLAQYCYFNMFQYNNNLITGPELPAATLVSNCYNGMFYSCHNLNYIKCLATNISASYCTNYWVSGVASSGVFVKSPNMNDWTTGRDGIPSGWTVQGYNILRYGDCINPTAVCRFDTNYVINANTEIEFKMNVYDTFNPGGWSNGETGCGTSGAYDGGLTSNYSKDRGTFNVLCGSYVNDYAYSYTRGNPITVTMKNGEYIFNGTSSTFETQTLSNTNPVWIGTDYHYWTGDIYYLKIYENGVLVRDYEPIIENNEPVLKDTITSNVCTFTGNTSALQLVQV